MSFIGVICKVKNESYIEQILTKKLKKNTIIVFTKENIENLKNIKFETIIVEDNLKKFKTNQEALEKIFENTQYLMINSDKNLETIKTTAKGITYGLNQKATVTISSISDTDILIYWQKSIQDREGHKIEIEERRIKRKEKNSLKTYELLIIYSFFKIYRKSIIEEI